ncbi:MAG: hypothetical protein F4Y07_03480 [Gemmatimonadetes bacterium]|nr:hypothetical protein [Gemmatimonadota bacterium]MYE15523.1 hypothetical protein [Gemmatimonadota bacterium]
MNRAQTFLATSLGVAVTLGCAGGGGGPPVSGEAAASLFATYSGRWELDVSSSTPQIPNQLEGVQDEVPVADIARNETREMRRYRRMYESRQMSVAHMRTTIEVLRRRPETLVLTVNEAELVYTPIPGETLTVPMDGSDLEIREGEHRVRTSIEWDGPLLALEHQVVSGGTVRETLEVVGDRMIMRRTVSGTGAGEPLVLAYDRN